MSLRVSFFLCVLFSLSHFSVRVLPEREGGVFIEQQHAVVFGLSSLNYSTEGSSLLWIFMILGIGRPSAILERLINFSSLPHKRKETFALFNDNCKVEAIMGCLPWHFPIPVRSTYLRQMAVPGHYRDEAFSPSHYVCHWGHFHIEKSQTINDARAFNNCEGIIFGKLHRSNNLFSL